MPSGKRKRTKTDNQIIIGDAMKNIEEKIKMLERGRVSKQQKLELQRLYRLYDLLSIRFE
jgi:hypothetical protein